MVHIISYYIITTKLSPMEIVIMQPSFITEPLIALIDGDTDREGRVEIYHKGQWGTIPGSLSHVEASYVCRKLGFFGGISVGNGHFGAGSGQFWNLNVTCLRTRWCSAVSHVTNGSKYNHSQDVGVVCGKSTKSA